MILPLSTQSLTVLSFHLSFQNGMEFIEDILKWAGSGDDIDTGTLVTDLINALAHVRLSHPAEISILTSLNPTGFRSRQRGG